MWTHFRTRLLLILFISVMIFPGCNSDDYADDNTTTADTSVVIHEEKPLVNELQDYPGLDPDSSDINVMGEWITIYGVRDGNELIVEGDMRFPINRRPFKHTEPGALEINTEKERGLFQRKKFFNKVQPNMTFGIGTTMRLWPSSENVISVYYKIDSKFKDSTRVKKAMDMWQRQGIVKFIPASGGNYILFISSINTNSPVGAYTGEKISKIASDKDSGNVAHEIGHILGLFHEQCRSDRKNYVRINCFNNDNYKFAYLIDSTAADQDRYNIYSIMHYKTDNCMSLIVSGLPRNIPGQRDSITTGDVASIKALYHFKK